VDEIRLLVFPTVLGCGPAAVHRPGRDGGPPPGVGRTERRRGAAVLREGRG